MKVPTQGAQPQQIQKQELHGKGEFDAAGSGGFKAQLDGTTWLLKYDPKAQVHVTGTATTEALVPGLFVRFSGEFDRRGKASEEIKQLEVFTPSQKNPLGAKAAGATAAFSEPTPAKKGPSTTPIAYEIAGRITSIKKGAMIVACPGLTVHAEVASDATITVDIADLAAASPGDKIEVRGWYIKGQEGRGYATDVEVALSNPLTGPKKKGARTVKPADKEKAGDAADSLDPKKTDKSAKKGADPKASDKKADDAKPADKDKADPAK